MSLDDISHAAHVGHLQGRIGELETKLREAQERARTAAAREDAANIFARQQDAELAQVRRAHLHELAEREKAEREREQAVADIARLGREVPSGACAPNDFATREAREALEALWTEFEKLRLARQKAEHERDEARGRLRINSVCLHGSGRHFERHGRQWSGCPDVECEKDRAALGEKP